MSGFIKEPWFSAFIDSDIGVTTTEPTVVEVVSTSFDPPLHYWRATCAIGSIFGSAVEGALAGIGKTREQALERLREERKNLADSLWA